MLLALRVIDNIFELNKHIVNSLELYFFAKNLVFVRKTVMLYMQAKGA